jgi:hypothetical protein
MKGGILCQHIHETKKPHIYVRYSNCMLIITFISLLCDMSFVRNAVSCQIKSSKLHSAVLKFVV